MIAEERPPSAFFLAAPKPIWVPQMSDDNTWYVIKLQAGLPAFRLVMTDKRCNQRCANEIADALNRIYA